MLWYHSRACKFSEKQKQSTAVLQYYATHPIATQSRTKAAPFSSFEKHYKVAFDV